MLWWWWWFECKAILCKNGWQVGDVFIFPPGENGNRLHTVSPNRIINYTIMACNIQKRRRRQCRSNDGAASHPMKWCEKRKKWKKVEWQKRTDDGNCNSKSNKNVWLEWERKWNFIYMRRQSSARYHECDSILFSPETDQTCMHSLRRFSALVFPPLYSSFCFVLFSFNFIFVKIFLEIHPLFVQIMLQIRDWVHAAHKNFMQTNNFTRCVCERVFLCLFCPLVQPPTLAM